MVYFQVTRRKSLASVLVLLVATVGFSIDAFSDENKNSLDAITPDYAAPPLDILEKPGRSDFAVSLLGLTLDQLGESISGEIPRIEGTTPLDVKTYWRAQVRMDSQVAAQLSFWDHSALIRVTEDFRIGPKPGESAWEVGGVYTTTHSADMVSLTQQFSGGASIVVSVRGASGKAAQLHPRQRLGIHITPNVRDSNIPIDAAQQAFGKDSRFIANRVRLGKGSRAELSVPEAWKDGNRQLAIVSAMSYRAPDQGVIVCDAVINPGAPDEVRLSMVSGVTTSLCNFDALPAGSANHKKVQVFSSRSSGQVDSQGAPVQLHNFVATLDLPDTVTSIQEIAFECDASVVLDIDGIALLP